MGWIHGSNVGEAPVCPSCRGAGRLVPETDQYGRMTGEFAREYLCSCTWEQRKIAQRESQAAMDAAALDSRASDRKDATEKFAALVQPADAPAELYNSLSRFVPPAGAKIVPSSQAEGCWVARWLGEDGLPKAKDFLCGAEENARQQAEEDAREARRLADVVRNAALEAAAQQKRQQEAASRPSSNWRQFRQNRRR